MSRQKGRWIEIIAKDFLVKQGLILVNSNFYSRFGEIDLIMQHKNGDFVFVEVKGRTNEDDGLYSVTYAKQNKLKQTAQYFMMKCGYELNCRFDLIIVLGNRECKWYKNIIF